MQTFKIVLKQFKNLDTKNYLYILTFDNLKRQLSRKFSDFW